MLFQILNNSGAFLTLLSPISQYKIPPTPTLKLTLVYSRYHQCFENE